ncbi:MFS transporter [Streptococcus danieliae]|uniref:MFS transporter n=1 Tax=Streptococcus danieliae TaxID=747656 RepID=A0A7Z0S450_9STRE|nr:MFS transporter [Streptococcus danieliae]MBF0698991.1 MFS transporter [Streptococcus danieliae]NYS96168.1 MFS transporter [Streptococcus danieliae]
MNQSFIKFLISQVLTILAGVLLDMALILFVYQKSQSLFETSMILVISSVAKILGSILLSNLFDKLSAKGIMAGTSLCKIFLIMVLAVTYTSIPTVLLMTFLLSFIGSALSPAQGVLLAHIAMDDRVRLNGIFYTVIQIFQTAIWTLGIPVVLVLKPFVVFYLIIILLLLSVVLLRQIDVKYRVQADSLSYRKRVRQGWDDLFHIAELRNVTIMDTCESIANVIWTQTFLLFFTTSFLGLPEEWWGFQGAAYFVGSILGGIISIRYSKAVSRLGGKVIFGSSLLVAILTGIYAFNKIAWFALVINFLIGIPYQIRDLVQQSLIQENSPTYSVGRIFTLRQLILTITSSSSLLIFSYLSSQIGIQSIYLIAAFIYSAVTIWIFLNRKIMNFSIREDKSENN